MRQFARDALRAKLPPDAVDPNDPLWTAFPIVRATGRRDGAAEDHDRYLYGSEG